MISSFTRHGRSAAAGRPPDPLQRVGMALVVSLCAHLLVLSWSPGLASGSVRHAARPTTPVLHVALNLSTQTREEPENSRRAPKARAEPQSAPPAFDPGNDARPRQSESQGSMRLLGYFPVADLHQMPVAIGRFEIQTPAGGDTGQDGRMTVRVWIGRDGRVERTQILSRDLPAAYASVAVKAFENLRFKPGEINGAAVPSWADIVIEYADFRN